MNLLAVAREVTLFSFIHLKYNKEGVHDLLSVGSHALHLNFNFALLVELRYSSVLAQTLEFTDRH